MHGLGNAWVSEGQGKGHVELPIGHPESEVSRDRSVGTGASRWGCGRRAHVLDVVCSGRGDLGGEEHATDGCPKRAHDAGGAGRDQTLELALLAHVVRKVDDATADNEVGDAAGAVDEGPFLANRKRGGDGQRERERLDHQDPRRERVE